MLLWDLVMAQDDEHEMNYHIGQRMCWSIWRLAGYVLHTLRAANQDKKSVGLDKNKGQIWWNMDMNLSVTRIKGRLDGIWTWTCLKEFQYTRCENRNRDLRRCQMKSCIFVFIFPFLGANQRNMKVALQVKTISIPIMLVANHYQEHYMEIRFGSDPVLMITLLQVLSWYPICCHTQILTVLPSNVIQMLTVFLSIVIQMLLLISFNIQKLTVNFGCLYQTINDKLSCVL